MHIARELRARTLRLDGCDYVVLRFRLPDPIVPPALTAAERAVAEAIARGESNAVIAGARGVSVSTIAKQAASLFKKLGVRSRLELAHALASRPLASSGSAP
jgi:DNA-binding NarL/FixJ family response regulator